jgi:hypothetical protein
MITKDDAVTTTYGVELHYGTCSKNIGPRGGVTIRQYAVRVTGTCQTWKTRPNDFRLPVKHGLSTYGAITHDNAQLFHFAADCNLNENTGENKE